MAMPKNTAYRLRRVSQNIAKAQDALHMANGFLYVETMRTYRDDLDKVLRLLTRFAERVERDIPPTKGGRLPKAAQADEFELDEAV